MYEESITASNRIITDKAIIEILDKMNENKQKYEKLAKQEAVENEKYDYKFQNWSLKNFSGSLKISVNFYDDTRIEFTDYYKFLGIFNSRIQDIKDLSIYFQYGFHTQHPNTQSKYYSQNIYMHIYESEVSISVSIDNENKIMDEVYDFIKSIIQNAPVKYDTIIEQKNKIISKVSFASGMIPSLIILSLSALIPALRQIYGQTYILFPIACIFLAYTIGSLVTSSKINNYYEELISDKKYAGYDHSKGKSIYKDDIEKYKQKSEVIIGKNINNLKYREEIKEINEKYSKYIKPEIIALIIISIIVIIIGKVI